MQSEIGSTCQIKALILFADNDSPVIGLKSSLMATGKFDSIATLNFYTNPSVSLTDIQDYDAILEYMNYGSADHSLIKQALQGYMDLGKGIVTCVASNLMPTWNLNLDNEYGVFGTTPNYTFGNLVLDSVFEPSHPIFENIDSISLSYNAYFIDAPLNPSAQILAKWENGQPAVAVRENIGTLDARSADLNLFANYDYIDDTNVFTLMANALVWVSQKCEVVEVVLYDNGKYALTPDDMANLSRNPAKYQSIEVTPRSFDCNSVGDPVSVTVSVIDTAGVSSSFMGRVKVYDKTAPEMVCKDITVSLDEEGKAYIFQNQVDGGSYDACGVEKLKLDKQQFNCGDIGMNLVTLTATDPSGNASTCTAHVTVVDDQVPVVEPVADIEMAVEPGVCETAVDYPELMVTDNCETSAELTSGLGADGMFPLGTTTETWTVTDEGGNTATVSFNVVVTTTNAAPTIDAVADITVDEDTAMVVVPLTGISHGVDCESQDVLVTATTDNPDLITSVTINYVDGPTGSVKLAVAPDMSGMAEIALLVTDSEGGEVADTFMVMVNPVNDPPYVVIPIADQVINASYELKIPISPVLGNLFDDVDDTTLIITTMVEGTDTLPTWIMFTGDTLYVTPMIADTGCVNIVVMATDAAGATAADTFQICVDGYPVSISEIRSGEFEVKMYPNPTSGQVNLDFNSEEIYEVDLSVMDIMGRVVLQKQYSAQQTIRFDMSDKVSGMYFVHLDFNRQQVIKKLIVNRK